MTKLRMAIAALGVATTVWGAPLLNAHETDKGSHKGKGHGEGMMKDMGMTDAQAEKFKAARKANMEAMKPLMEKQKLDVDSLKVLVDKKASDNELKAAIASVKADHQAIDDQRKKQHETMGAMLTPLQEAKMIIRMGGMGAQMMMGGGMGGGMMEGKMGKGGMHKGGHDKDDDDDDDHGKGGEKEHEHKGDY
jgi:Spy/CpxP family protein refolding chaperone